MRIIQYIRTASRRAIATLAIFRPRRIFRWWPGFFFGKKGKPAPREVLRKTPFERIAFANTDLAGAMDHRYSILEAQRAVQQILDQVLT